MSKLYGVLAVMLFGGSCFAQDNGGSPGWVVLPIHDYAALRTKAFPPPERTAQAPVQATLTRIDYDLRIEGAVASGRASLTVDVLKDGWVRIPIPQGLLVRDARLGSERLSLVPTPENPKQLSAVLSQRGRSILLLDVAFTVSTAGAEERLSLPVGASGVTRSIVSLAPQDLDVTVTGGYMAEKSAGRWLAYAQGSRPLTFAWRKKIEERRVELPARLRTSLTQLFGLGEDATSLNAEVTVEMMQGAATQLKIAVPDTVTINQVPGANVGDWDVRNGNPSKPPRNSPSPPKPACRARATSRFHSCASSTPSVRPAAPPLEYSVQVKSRMRAHRVSTRPMQPSSARWSPRGNRRRWPRSASAREPRTGRSSSTSPATINKPS